MKFSAHIFRAVWLCLALTGPAFSQVNITMWQADHQHTGANLNETILTPALVSSPGNFGLLFSQPMDGQCYTQPLYVSGLTISGVAHNVIYVETEHCTVYAFDADTNTGTNASPLWSKSFLTAGVNTPVPQGDVGSGDISVELGNTSTPVIDTVGQTIYCLSKVKVTANGSYQQYLHALDLATGAEKFGGPVLINPTFAGNAPDAVGGLVPFSPLHEHARAALTLYNGIVYVMYASHSDTNPYHGEIIGYDASTLAQVKTFITSPNGQLDGIWQGGASAAIDSAGNIYVGIGNGPTDYSASASDWGDSMIKLPTAGTFNVSNTNTLNWFTPSNWNDLNNGDLDVGSSGLTLLPDQAGGTHPHLLVGGGKGGTLYVVDRDNMSGLNTPDKCVQEITETNALFVTPSYFNNSIYYAPAGGRLTQRTVGYNPADNTYVSTTAIKSNFTYNGAHGSGVFITANGTSNGLVWTLDLGQPAHLHAYNATNVSGDPIYSGTATLPGNINVKGPTFGLPMAANGKVYYAGYDPGTNIGYLMVYGQPAPVAGTPAAATNVTATPVSSTEMTISWTDNSDNESGFKISRATALAGPYTVLTPSPSVGANVTTFTDSGLSPSTAYYYQVIPTNANGDSTPSVAASATTFPVYAEKGLVAYWNLDETSGSTSADLTGNGHLGTWAGEQNPDAGFINGSHFFHGTGAVASRISVADAADLEFAANQSFTLAAWVKPAALRGSAEAVIEKSRDSGNYYGIWIDANNHWVARGPNGDMVGPLAVQDAWTHVAVVQNGAAGTRALYINGTLAASGPAQPGDGLGALWMSQANSGGGTVIEAFPGNIDEVRIYNRALATNEISRLLSPPVVQAVSSIQQGAASYQLVLAPTLTTAIEPRKGATPGTYNLVLSFSAPVSGLTATLQLQSGGAASGTVGTLTYDAASKVVTIPLTGVADAQNLNLHLAGIQPGNGTADVPFNVLWGDVNGDNVVTGLDQRIVTNNAAPGLTNSTFLYDVNGDGAVNTADATLVNSLIGTNVGPETDSNLALFAPAFSSSDNNGGSTALQAVDGNATTRWESVQGVDPQWIYVDLGAQCSIHSVSFLWEDASGKTYTIESSNVGGANDSDWSTIATEANNPPGGGLRTYPVSATTRYVRMHGTTRNTGYGYSIYEFQVLGVPNGSVGGPAPSITSPLTASGEAGSAFDYQIQATNSPTSYGATGLPSGLSINPATGEITGAPASSGHANTIITASNANGTDNETLAITISPAAGGTPPVITSSLTAIGTVGSGFTYTISASSSALSSPATYGASALPSGFSVDPATGIITGVPTAAGTTDATITATNDYGTTTKTLVINVSATSGAGDTNLALTGTATATSFEGNDSVGYAAANTIDNNTNTRWSSLFADPQTLTVDLGQKDTIHSVAIVWEAAAGATYTVDVSDDDSHWTNLATETNNSTAGTRSYTAQPGMAGRYVRMHGTTRDSPYGYSVFEFRIFGVTGVAPAITSPLSAAGTVGAAFSYPIVASNSPTSYTATPLPDGLTLSGNTISGTPTAPGSTSVTITATNATGTDTETLAITVAAGADTNLAMAGTPSSSTVQAANPMTNADDGSATTRWSASDGTYPQWWKVDLGASKTLSKVDINWYSFTTRAYKYEIETSPDDVNYTQVADKTANKTFGNTSDPVVGTARYVRITVTGSTAGFASAYEFKVYGH